MYLHMIHNYIFSAILMIEIMNPQTLQDIKNFAGRALYGGIDAFNGLISKKVGDPQEALYIKNQVPQTTNPPMNMNAMQSGGLKDVTYAPNRLQQIVDFAKRTLTPKIVSPIADNGMAEYINNLIAPQTVEAAQPPVPSQTTSDQSKAVPYFDFQKYFNIPKPYASKITQPPPEKAQMLFNAFEPTGEATAAAMAAWGENAMRPYDDFKPEDPFYMNALGGGQPVRNPNDSFDRGWMHSNSNTFADLLRLSPYKNEMAAKNITNYKQVDDPQTAVDVAKITRDMERNAGLDPFGWWYGWKNKGITRK